MRYTRGVVLKDGQFEQMAELQIDTIALQRGMLVEENAGINCKKEKIGHNTRMIQRTDGRWGTSRTSEADAAKNPLINYKEWIAIDGKLRELPIAEQVGDSRWNFRDERPTEEKWKWLQELMFYPAQRPVRPITEEPGLGDLGQEKEPPPWTDIEEGETERERAIDLLDREKGPKLNAGEWGRLKTCERPRTKEE